MRSSVLDSFFGNVCELGKAARCRKKEELAYVPYRSPFQLSQGLRDS